MRKTLLFACVGHFFVDFCLGIWPIFKTIVHLDLAVAGMIAAACIIVGESLQFLFGPLADRGHQKLLFIIGPILTALSALLGYVEGVLFYFIIYFLTCIGSAAFHPTAAAVLEGFPNAKKGMAMGFFVASGMLGLALSQFCFAWTYQALETQTAILALPVLLFSGVIFLIFQPPSRVLQDKRPKLELFLYYASQPTVRVLYCLLLACQTMLWSTVFLLPELLFSRKYPEWMVLGGGHFFFMLGATLIPPFIGWIADRVSMKKAIICNLLFAVIELYAILVPQQYYAPLTLLFLFMLGAQLVGSSVLCWALGGKIASRSPATINALLMGGVWIISESAGIGGSAFLADVLGQDGPALSLSYIGIALPVALFFAFKLPEEQVAIDNATAAEASS